MQNSAAELKLQFLCKLSSLRQFQEDPEYVHIKADALLCELLTQLGFSEVVDEYISLPKYYS